MHSHYRWLRHLALTPLPMAMSGLSPSPGMLFHLMQKGADYTKACTRYHEHGRMLPMHSCEGRKGHPIAEHEVVVDHWADHGVPEGGPAQQRLRQPRRQAVACPAPHVSLQHVSRKAEISFHTVAHGRTSVGCRSYCDMLSCPGCCPCLDVEMLHMMAEESAFVPS